VYHKSALVKFKYLAEYTNWCVSIALIFCSNCCKTLIFIFKNL